MYNHRDFKSVCQKWASLNKPVLGVSDKVRHKPGRAATEDGSSLETSDLGSRGLVLIM